MASWRDAPLVETTGGGSWRNAPLADAPVRAPGKGSVQAIGQEDTPSPSLLTRARDLVTGELRTEFPDAPEFGRALTEAAHAAGRGTPAPLRVLGSLVTPDPKAQVDILRQGIPDLEERTDAHGNVMLRAPSVGVTGWAYLNKPGVSARDAGETLVQGLPFLATGAAGLAATAGRGLLARAGALGVAGAGTSATEDVAAMAAGSEQGVDAGRAGVSGALGVATAPGVPSAVARTVAAPVVNTVRTIVRPESEAFRRVGTALQRDADAAAASTQPGPTRDMLDPADVRMAEDITGQPLATMDYGGATTRRLERQAANASPEGQGTIERFVGQRFEGQSERAGEYLRGLVGNPAQAHQMRQGLNRASETTLPPLYEAAYRHPVATAGVYNATLDAISQEPAMQAAMKAANAAMQRKRAAGTLLGAPNGMGPGGNPTLEYWDQVQRALSDRISTLVRSGAREEGRDVTLMRQRLMTELDRQFPHYAQARGTAATFFRAADALEAGENFATQTFERAAARDAVGAMTPNDQLMFRQGFASRAIERLENTADRRSVINQLVGSPAAREKLEIALGRNAANEMEAFMRIEGVMDMARGALGNSTTARQLADLGIAGGVGIAGAIGISSPAGLLAAALTWGIQRGGRAAEERVAAQVAQVLVSQDPAVRQRAIASVARNPQMMSRMRMFFEALPRAAGQQQAGDAQQ